VGWTKGILISVEVTRSDTERRATTRGTTRHVKLAFEDDVSLNRTLIPGSTGQSGNDLRPVKIGGQLLHVTSTQI
jgi:hypothetical protein